ncbi:MAG: PEP-CTERM sorting domain-containing protein [Nitrospiraceae bacterium]
MPAGLRQDNYTYLYQITNRLPLHPPPPGPPWPFLAEFSVRAGGPVTATGTFVQAGSYAQFLDYGRALEVLHQSPCTFPRCGIDGPGGSLDGATGFGIAIRPNEARTPFVTNSGSTSWQFYEPGAASHTSRLVLGTTSSIVGFQSPNAPLLGIGSNSFALEGAPREDISGIAVPSSSAPEPTTFSVMALGLVLLAAWRTKDIVNCRKTAVLEDGGEVGRVQAWVASTIQPDSQPCRRSARSVRSDRLHRSYCPRPRLRGLT